MPDPYTVFAWFHDILIHWIILFFAYVLSAGPIPKHVAFIMDGNRRYARRLGRPPEEGHMHGALAWLSIMKFCLALNIRCLTCYLFAIDNFRRSEVELNALFTNFLTTMNAQMYLFHKCGVKVNFIGRTELFPAYLQEGMKTMADKTRNNNRFILNMCMGYSSQDEITEAVKSSIEVAFSADPSLDGNVRITSEAIESNLQTSLVGSPPLDILIRTSGVHRLSDFLLWQCCNDTQIQFVEALWPEFGLRHLIPIILDFQRKVWTSHLK